MPASLATVNAITKEIYAPKVRKQLNDEVRTLTRIKRDKDRVVNEVGGKYVTFPVHTRRNTGIGARNENEALPSAGQQGTAAARIGLKYLYGAVELTGQTIALVDTDTQAFVNAADFEMERLRVDLARDLNRQVYGSSTGTLATVTATMGSAGLTATVNDTRLLDLAMYVDVVAASDGTVLAAGRTITAKTATTVTLSGANFTATTSHIIVRGGNYNREWTGFNAIVQDAGVLHNIDPATEPEWKATVDSNSGTNRALSEGLLTTMADTIWEKGSNPTVIFTTVGVMRAYANLLTQQRQYVNTDGKFSGGFKSLAFMTTNGEIPMVVDAMAPKNTAWFINEDHIKLYQEGDWDFMTYGNGDKWRLKTTGGNDYDAYIARLFQYSDLGTDRRNSHGVVRDITEN